MSKIAYVSVLGLAAAIAACSATTDNATDSDNDLRGISSTEALMELEQVGNAIRAYYGPLQFKQQKFGFNLDTEITTARAAIKAGKTEGDRVRPIMQLLAKLHDSHVSYQYPMPGSASAEYDLPLLITPTEGKYLVDLVSKSITTVAHGDEVISIDGKSPAQLNDELKSLTGEGNPDTEIIMTASLMTFRPFYIMNDLIPTQATAHVVVAKPDGSQVAVDMPWRKTAGGIPALAPPSGQASASTGNAAQAFKAQSKLNVESNFSTHANFLRAKKAEIKESGLGDFDSLQPFWLTPQVQAALNVQPTAPKAATLANLGVTLPPANADGTQPAPAFLGLGAYKYQYEGKTVMVVRIPGFEVPQTSDPNEDTYGENIAWLAALLQDNLAAPSATTTAPADTTTTDAGAPAPTPTDAPADVIVLDETANPGGLATYALGIASLFATKPIPSLSQAMHADRTWISDFSSQAQSLAQYPDFANVAQSRATTIETAYDAKQWLSAFMPLTGDYIGPNAPVTPDVILGGNMLAPNANVQWGKPVLILHDNLSVSCADFFPAILQNGGVAKTFGATTMGGGGNVEQVLTQSFSGAILSLTRGMGGPYNPNGTPKLIENAGVTPDFAHPITVADFRAGFVDYANSFSHIAATLTRAE